MSSYGLAHRVQTLDKVTISQGLKYCCPQPSHNTHACHHIGRVSELHSNSRQWGAHGTHAEWKHIHGSACERKCHLDEGFQSVCTFSLCVPALVTLHAAWKPLIHSLLELSWGHPVAQLSTGPTSREGHCVSLRRSYNHRLALYSCYILGVCAGQPAGGNRIIRMRASRSLSSPDPTLTLVLLLFFFPSIRISVASSRFCPI